MRIDPDDWRVMVAVTVGATSFIVMLVLAVIGFMALFDPAGCWK